MKISKPQDRLTDNTQPNPSVFSLLEVTAYDHIIKKMSDKTVTKQLPTSVEFKASNALTTLNDDN